jgi:hypothetical protein
MTLGSRDQFRMIAVVSGPETFEDKVVWRSEWVGVSPSLNALEIRREIASGLTAKKAASNTVLEKDSHKILLRTSILVRGIVVYYHILARPHVPSFLTTTDYFWEYSSMPK